MKKQPARQGLYRPQNERDACGVGLVASVDNRPARRIVELGLAALVNMTQRGAGAEK